MSLKLIKNPAERTSALNESRNLKMARSAHACVRGSTVKFYEWLSTSAAQSPRGPPVWICGDCHLGNLGPLADIKGRVEVQIRDLDQTVIGNPAHDLIRLGLSLASAARGSDLPGVATARILEALARGYTAALDGDFTSDRDQRYQPEIIQNLLRRSVRRRWRNLADERLKTVEPKLPLGKRFWPLAPEEDKALAALFDNVEIGAAISGLAGDASGKVELIDAAYWLKGCSSLGRLRFAAMVRVGEGKSASMSLIDIKEATTAAAPRARNVSMPRDNGVRVVTGA